MGPRLASRGLAPEVPGPRRPDASFNVSTAREPWSRLVVASVESTAFSHSRCERRVTSTCHSIVREQPSRRNLLLLCVLESARGVATPKGTQSLNCQRAKHFIEAKSRFHHLST